MVAWLEAHEKLNNGYRFAKECIILYTIWRAPELTTKDIRINCICPGVTTTPMYKEYWEKGLLRGGLNSFQGVAHRNAVPEEMAWPMLFLNSSMASYITAQSLYVDYGNIILNKLGLMK